MMKKYLFNCLFLFAVGLIAVSCSKEEELTEADYASNAEKVLGVEIDPEQDWVMSRTVTVNITVNLGLDQSYTVAVYDQNPLYSDDVAYYCKETVTDGSTVTTTLSLPTASNTYYAAVFDSKLRRVVKSFTVTNDVLDVTFGEVEANAPTRTMNRASETGQYARKAEKYLNPTKARNIYGEWNLTTQQISVSEMKNYPAFTDADIEKNSTLTNGTWTWSQEKGSYQEFIGGGDGKHFRVASGTEITKVFHVNGTNGVTNDVVIYVEGKMHLNGNTLNGPTIVVDNGGEVVIDGNTDMSNAGRIVILAGGKLTGSSGKQFNVNNGAPCYNAGTINFAGELNVNGSDFYNCGTITVDVLRNTSGGYFTNFGKVTARTNTVAGDSYNSIVINGCYMYYTANAGIGTLTNLESSRLEVGGIAEFNQATQTLENNSLIKAGTLYLNSTTFSGPNGASKYAVIQTDRISVNQGADLGSQGNIYWDWNISNLVDHNYQVTDNCTVDNGYTYLSYIKNLNLNYTSESNSIVSIPSGDCTGPGYNDGDDDDDDDDDDDIPGSSNVYTYAFEDTFMGDYDMNDVVLQVCIDPSDSQKLQVTLCCTGAAYDLYVYFNSKKLFGGREVHTVLAGSGAKGKFINTGDGSSDKFLTAEPYTATIDKPSDFSFETANFWIKSPAGNIQLSTTGKTAQMTTKNAPYGVMIPKKWAWPKEWTPVSDAYSTFVNFAKNRTKDADWYDSPVNGMTYSE